MAAVSGAAPPQEQYVFFLLLASLHIENSVSNGLKFSILSLLTAFSCAFLASLTEFVPLDRLGIGQPFATVIQLPSIWAPECKFERAVL